MDFLFNSIYAGLLPQISHSLIIYLWSSLLFQREGYLITFLTLFSEILMLLISLGFFYYYLTEEKKEAVKNKIKLVYQNLKEKGSDIIFYIKKQWKNQKLIEKNMKLDVDFQKKLEEIKPKNLSHLFISVERDNDGFIKPKKRLYFDSFKSKNSSPETKREENDIPINTSSIMDSEMTHERETIPQNFSQKVDIDISEIPILSTDDKPEKNQNTTFLDKNKSNNSNDEISIDKQTFNESKENLKDTESENLKKNPLKITTIDPEKIPSVFNNQFKQSNHQALADINLLNQAQINIKNHDLEDSIRKTAKKLEETIKEFGIATKVIRVSTGPVITQYELTVEAGVKISKIVNLSDKYCPISCR